MKARLVPLYFNPGRDDNFDIHLKLVKDLLQHEIEF